MSGMSEEAERHRYMDVGQRCACLGLRQAARAVTQFYDRALEPTGLRITQFSILAVLRVVAPASTNRLAEILVMDRTTLSRNVDLLEEEGLAERRRSPEDGRVREVLLTDAGREKLERAYPRWERAQEAVEEALDGDGIRELHGFLDRAVDATWEAA
jgi:DNA-binding MarR family transcriptional regulator